MDSKCLHRYLILVQGRLCQVFERKESMEKNWQYLIDTGK